VLCVLLRRFAVSRAVADPLLRAATIGQHFGPIHSIIVHPSGKCFASGGEDGYGE
jgi:hypothetical protein